MTNQLIRHCFEPDFGKDVKIVDADAKPMKAEPEERKGKANY